MESDPNFLSINASVGLASVTLGVTIEVMIKSFTCHVTRAFFAGKRIPRFVTFEATAMRKLQQLHAAPNLDFLRVPPGNRLEALTGDRVGQHSIRINDQ